MTNVTVTGTSFPGSPTTGEDFFRTDLGLWCYYDGTRWLTIDRYAADISIKTTPVSASSTYFVRTQETYSVYVVETNLTTFVPTTNDGSNYWSGELRAYDSLAANPASILSYSTVADAADVYVNQDTAPTTATPASKGMFAITCSKTASPGAMRFWAEIIYRLIIT